VATEDSIEQYFMARRSEFDKAEISTILVATEDLAKELKMRVAEDGDDFHRLARQYSLDAGSKLCGGYVGLMSRRSLPPAAAAMVFGAAAGEVLGPFRRGDLFQLIFVEEVRTGELSQDVRVSIAERVFSEWVSRFLKDGFEVRPQPDRGNSTVASDT